MTDFDSPSAQERQHHADQRERRDAQTARWADVTEAPREPCPWCNAPVTDADWWDAEWAGGRWMHGRCYYSYDRYEQVYAAAYPLPNGRNGQ